MQPIIKGGQGRTPTELTDSAGGMVIVYTVGANILAVLIILWFLLRG